MNSKESFPTPGFCVSARGGLLCRAGQFLPGRLPKLNHNNRALPASARTVGASGKRASTNADLWTERDRERLDAACAQARGALEFQRRKHAVKRGRLVLDALDELKLGLLGGTFGPATLTKLKSAAAHLRDGSGDSSLDAVLGEIELRVEVEIAKMAPR